MCGWLPRDRIKHEALKCKGIDSNERKARKQSITNAAGLGHTALPCVDPDGADQQDARGAWWAWVGTGRVGIDKMRDQCGQDRPDNWDRFRGKWVHQCAPPSPVSLAVSLGSSSQERKKVEIVS